MRKVRLGLLLVMAVALIAMPVSAGKHGDFELNGQLRARAEMVDNYQDQDDDADDSETVWPYRVMLGITGKFDRDIWAHVDLQANGYFGDQATPTLYPFAGVASPFGFIGTSDRLGNVDIYQGYVQLDDMGDSEFSLRIGRTEHVLGNELHMGDNDFYNGTVFDGARLSADFGKWQWDGFFYNVLETGDDDDDQWLLGTTASCELGGGAIEPYILLLRNDAEGTGRQNLATIGALWERDDSNDDWDLSIEAAFQSGDTGLTPAAEIDYGGTIFEGEFGWSFGDAGRVHVGFLMASGDDNGIADGDQDAFQQLFPDPHANNRLGDMDLFATQTFLGGTSTPLAGPMSNVEDLNLGYEIARGDHNFRVNVHDFTIADLAGPGSDELGQELDLVYNFDYSKNAGFEVGVGNFFVGDAFGTTADDIMRIWGQLNVAWGN